MKTCVALLEDDSLRNVAGGGSPIGMVLVGIENKGGHRMPDQAFAHIPERLYNGDFEDVFFPIYESPGPGA